MTGSTVLVIEDDKIIQRFLRISLNTNGYKPVMADSVSSAISIFLTHNPDVILLDLGLPDKDGMVFLRYVREKGSETPIIVLSARSQESDKIAALDAGADDYVVKPFSVGEVLARIRVALRHVKTTAVTRESFVLNGLEVNFERRKVFSDGVEKHLTPLEYKMLLLFIEYSGKVLTHKFIQTHVWGYDTTDDYKTVRVFVANIRRKIERDASNPKFILTEVGVGYRFADE